jgi:hypothetical protein
MSITVDWYNPEKTIIQYVLEGKWTWNEFYDVYHKAIAMENAVSHRVDVVVDIRQSAIPPTNVLLNMKYFADHQPPNIGLSLIVSASPLIRSLYDVALKFHRPIGECFRIVSTPEEAFDLIADARRERAS